MAAPLVYRNQDGRAKGQDMVRYDETSEDGSVPHATVIVALDDTPRAADIDLFVDVITDALDGGSVFTPQRIVSILTIIDGRERGIPGDEFRERIEELVEEAERNLLPTVLERLEALGYYFAYADGLDGIEDNIVISAEPLG